MVRRPTENYFFVVEQDANYNAAIYTSGEGNEVLPALARLSLLHAANVEQDLATDYTRSSDTPYDAISETINGTIYDPPEDRTCHVVSALALSEIFNPTSGQGRFSRILDEHRAALLGQIVSGGRSPESVQREMAVLMEDLRCVHAVSSQWYDSEGRHIVQPIFRMGTYEEKRVLHPVLNKLTKSDLKRQLNDKQQEALISQLPPRTTPYSIQVLPLRRKRAFIDWNHPLMHGMVMNHTTYGYLADKTTDFVPVLSVLSEEHPARKAKTPRRKAR